MVCSAFFLAINNFLLKVAVSCLGCSFPIKIWDIKGMVSMAILPGTDLLTGTSLHPKRTNP